MEIDLEDLVMVDLLQNQINYNNLNIKNHFYLV